jgi:hypothetical protein
MATAHIGTHSRPLLREPETGSALISPDVDWFPVKTVDEATFVAAKVPFAKWKNSCHRVSPVWRSSAQIGDRVDLVRGVVGRLIIDAFPE